MQFLFCSACCINVNNGTLNEFCLEILVWLRSDDRSLLLTRYPVANSYGWNGQLYNRLLWRFSGFCVLHIITGWDKQPDCFWELITSKGVWQNSETFDGTLLSPIKHRKVINSQKQSGFLGPPCIIGSVWLSYFWWYCSLETRHKSNKQDSTLSNVDYFI